MRATIIVTIPSWLKLPVLGECEDGHYEGRGVLHHHVHSDHDGADKRLVEFQILLDTQDVAEYFLVSRCNIYVCLSKQRDESLALPTVNHEKRLKWHNHNAQANSEHIHKAQLLIEYLDLAWVHQEPEYLAF
jgi:hypothetical protein